MKVDKYALEIIPGTEDDTGYVQMQHGQVYVIRIVNDDYHQADAEVFVDGNAVGVFRLPRKSSLDLEHPSTDSGRFTFYELMSREGSAAGIRAHSDLGVVQAHFYPEKDREFFLGTQPQSEPNPEREREIERMLYGDPPEDGYIAGGTGLSGASNQQFHSVSKIERDPDKHVVITLRLAGVKSAPRPLNPTVVANAVPPPLT